MHHDDISLKFLKPLVANALQDENRKWTVFWPWGTHWVDAMPRPATREEVSDAVLNSMRRYF